MDIKNIDRAYDLLKRRKALVARIDVLKDCDGIDVIAKIKYLEGDVILSEFGKKRDVRDFIIDKTENYIEEIDDELKTL